MSLIYAIGDIHGSLDKLRRLMLHCEQDAGGRPMTFVFLGDYIDRGPQSCGVISFLIDLQSRCGDRVVLLKGNHEAMALGAIDGTGPVRVWLAQGGVATLKSYGNVSPAELPRAHVDWMRTLRLSYDDDRRFFVHAGVDPRKPLAEQEAVDMLWIREPFLSDTRGYGRLVVHGHTLMMTGACAATGSISTPARCSAGR
jgi:serine/threonine protein phosphatase 1